MGIQVEVYEDERGTRPFEEWFDRLPATHAAKVTTAVVWLEGGNRSGLKPVARAFRNGGLIGVPASAFTSLSTARSS
jgi:hypothetical protein